MTTQPLESDAFRRYDLAVSGAAEWLNILLLNSGRSNLGKELNKSKSSIDNASEEMVLGTLNAPEWKIKDEALKIISDARQALSSEDLDVSIPKKLAKLQNFDWDEKRYRKYVSDYSPDTFLNQVDGADEVPELMGTIDGIYIGIDVITELIELLDEGKKVPNIYWQEDSTMVFASNNETHLRIVYNKVYDELVSHTQRMVNVGMVDKETIISNEINMFQSIFDPIYNKPDVDYLGKRLGLPEYDVNEIIKKRNAVLSGEYVRAFYTYNQELRIDYGILLGVQAYLKYLRAGMVHSEEPDVISKVTAVNLSKATDNTFIYEPGDNLTLKKHGRLGDELTGLRDGLKSLGLIANNTRANVFTDIFTDNTIKKTVIWKGNQYELHLLVKSLKPFLVKNRRSMYKRAAKVFIPSPGTAFGNLENTGSKNIEPQREKKYSALLEHLQKSLKEVLAQKN